MAVLSEGPEASRAGTAEMIILNHRLSALEVLLSQAMAMLLDMKGTVECRVPQRSEPTVTRQDHLPQFVPQYGGQIGHIGGVGSTMPSPGEGAESQQSAQHESQSWFSNVFGGSGEGKTDGS